MKALFIILFPVILTLFSSCQMEDINGIPDGLEVAQWDTPMNKAEGLSVAILINTVDTITQEQNGYITEWICLASIQNRIPGGTVYDYYLKGYEAYLKSMRGEPYLKRN